MPVFASGETGLFVPHYFLHTCWGEVRLSHEKVEEERVQRLQREENGASGLVWSMFSDLRRLLTSSQEEEPAVSGD